MRSGVASDCRRPLSPRVTFGETDERGTVGRLTLEQNEADDQSDAEVLGVCHRPGCAVPDTGCAKTLIGQSALKSRVEVSGAHVGFPTCAR